MTPGVVDIHGHYYHGTDPSRGYSNGFNSLPPDGFTFPAGVTTVVDAGGAGWRNFRHFKEQVIGREDLGNLDIGTEADVAVFSLRNGRFGFVDGFGNRLEGTQLLEADLTIRAGRIVWDRNGRSYPLWNEPQEE